MSKLAGILDKAQELLQGEPLRAIGYGAGVIVYFVARASGRFEDIPLDDAIILTGTAATTLIGVIETARRFVFSANTVETVALVAETHGADAALSEFGFEDGDTT